METCRPCGCKGCRTCLICEAECGIKKTVTLNKEFGTYVYCPYCNKAYSGWDVDDYKQHPNHTGKSIEYPGVYIQMDFLTENEESALMKSIDSDPWDTSQSGRRKQNYGPKCNFKKMKLQIGNFDGFPSYTKFIQDRFAEVNLLKDFYTIEQCSLEYNPERGASIDPHVDDCWIWGERIVTANLLSDSVLTMTFNSKPDGYNLKNVRTYPSCVKADGKPFFFNNTGNNPIVRIPMPNRSLLILYGSARYEWEHQILREDIVDRRVCIAYREFTPPYLKGGDKYDKSEEVFEKSTKTF